MNWVKFTTQEPSRDGTPILVIWYKGKQKEKHLAVAWRSIDELIYVHKIGADDELRWWVPLTDPDEEIEKDAKLQAVLTKQKTSRNEIDRRKQMTWKYIYDELPELNRDVLWCNPYSKIVIVEPRNPAWDGNLDNHYFQYWMYVPEMPKLQDDKHEMGKIDGQYRNDN